ncbi:Longitudinals lacking protein, isoforms N/O/W/X/Y [Frankliniella fusca]|uniref:Longitudinals lacking protein, isoforms N/O/W/X/Y n=1 Tax=Frankliniella fusca TaxID=407009 RepID=A0AAE1H608_9NEOP|nr:Longitudinals lacking protein, isoforms N/O/W/X/Y [Frankliniella fusca]
MPPSQTRKRQWVCSNCGKRYNYVSSFNRHRKLECGKEPGFLCALCPYRDANSGNVFGTVFVMDCKMPPPLRPLSPPRQGKSACAANKAKARAMLPQHQGSYVCTQCGKAYNHDQSLWRHRKFECGKEGTFQCPHCDHRSRRRSHLTDHVQRKHGKLRQLFPPSGP